MPPKRVIQHGAQSQTHSSVEPATVQSVIQTKSMKRKAILSKDSQEPVSKKPTTSRRVRSASPRMVVDSSNKCGTERRVKIKLLISKVLKILRAKKSSFSL